MREDLPPDNQEPSDNAHLSQYELVRKVSRRLVIVLIIWLLVETSFFIWCTLKADNIPVIFICLSCGILGGFIGLQRRLKTLSKIDLQLLSNSWYYVSLSPIVGGFLAVLLYVIFISELVKGSLFPSFTLDEADLSKKGTLLFQDLFQVHATSYQDYAKLLAWSFIAGFSEKFVTDILGQFGSVNTGNKE